MKELIRTEDLSKTYGKDEGIVYLRASKNTPTSKRSVGGGSSRSWNFAYEN